MWDKFIKYMKDQLNNKEKDSSKISIIDFIFRGKGTVREPFIDPKEAWKNNKDIREKIIKSIQKKQES